MAASSTVVRVSDPGHLDHTALVEQMDDAYAAYQTAAKEAYAVYRVTSKRARMSWRPMALEADTPAQLDARIARITRPSLYGDPRNGSGL